MAYQLQPMLKIRDMREDRAQTALASARRARVKAEQVLEEKIEKRKKYEETKEERRDKIFDTIIGKAVSMDKINDVRCAVTRIDEEGVLLEQDERKAADVVEEKTREAEAAHGQYVAAAKDLAKIQEHRKAWEEEDRKMQEMLADAEMEEFSGRKLVSEDDDTFD